MEAVSILPEPGRGTMRSMVEGHVPVILTAREWRGVSVQRRENSRVPLHHPLRGWSPSPKGEDL